jgi:peptide-methionine (S)-S-oxide reductase
MLTRLFAVLALLTLPMSLAQAQTTEDAIVAGGCFWCVESDFRRVPGVVDVRVGFTGGGEPNPTYEQVTRGMTTHLEAARITFDPAQISYDQIVHMFLRSIDVFDAGGQFCDRGRHYTTAIFVTPAQDAAARAAVAQAEAELGQQIVTPVRGVMPFYDADEFHQNYANSTERTFTRFGWIERSDAYKRYREGCGRDARVRQVWGDTAPFLR